MNKNEYLDALNVRLISIPESERYDLIRELDYRIAYQLQRGKTEDEILRELGDPTIRAELILGERNRRIEKEFSQAYSPSPSSRPDFLRMLGVGIVLFFLNIVALPVLISLGAAVLSIGVSAVAAIASPALDLLESMWNNSFYPASLFAHAAAAGVGILLILIFLPLAKLGLKGCIAYAKWNLRLLRGR